MNDGTLVADKYLDKMVRPITRAYAGIAGPEIFLVQDNGVVLDTLIFSIILNQALSGCHVVLNELHGAHQYILFIKI